MPTPIIDPMAMTIERVWSSPAFRRTAGSLVAVLAMLQAADELRMARSHARSRVLTWWGGIERTQRRHLRLSQAAFLVRAIGGNAR